MFNLILKSIWSLYYPYGTTQQIIINLTGQTFAFIYQLMFTFVSLILGPINLSIWDQLVCIVCIYSLPHEGKSSSRLTLRWTPICINLGTMEITKSQGFLSECISSHNWAYLVCAMGRYHLVDGSPGKEQNDLGLEFIRLSTKTNVALIWTPTRT